MAFPACAHPFVTGRIRTLITNKSGMDQAVEQGLHPDDLRQLLKLAKNLRHAAEQATNAADKDRFLRGAVMLEERASRHAHGTGHLSETAAEDLLKPVDLVC